jgi:putative ABC transport system ATP-binding protein
MVNLEDEALSRLRNRKIGFVFQQFHLLQRATALQNVTLPLIYAERYPADAETRAAGLLAVVGLSEHVSHRPNQLSGGQQQRVAIARALVTDPAMVLADEPTGNLDSKSGAEVMAIFERLNAEGRTIIVVTHDRAIAEHAKRIIILRDGAVAEDIPVAQRRDAAKEAQALAEKEVGT